MRALIHTGFAATIAIAVMTLGATRGEAHKPITSPYTYNEDVFPVLRDRCGRCHVSGGVAPMSLMTHGDTVPWGESIKAELLAGSMPPWSVDTAPGRFRNVEGLTAREMNVLLTWVTGGTPPGNADKDPEPIVLDTSWRLGRPDLELQVPMAATLDADTRERTQEFTIATGLRERRFVRAVDLRPGTPSIVRAATVSVKAADSGDVERILALWLPGDTPVPLDQGAGYELPAGAEITVRVLYRKTWEYERKEMSDRSTVAVYFAPESSSIVDRMTLIAGSTIDRNIRALAIYPTTGLRATRVTAIARTPDGSRVDLIAFHPRADWTRRYWFTEPIALPRGTRIDVTTTPDDEMMMPLTAPPTGTQVDPSMMRLILNVVADR